MKKYCKGLIDLNNHEAIGFIDSGVGGLTVVKEAMRQLPNERLIYLGDTARCPYGPRPAEQVVQFTWEMTNFLLEKKIKMLVIACNTATAVALEEIKAYLDIPVVGVILPGTRAALKATKNNRIGIIGTAGTIKSSAYEKALKSKVPNTFVSSLACPKFVPLVESNEFHSSVAKKVVSETLNPLQLKKLDTLILGCTHYPLLRPLIQNVMGSQVKLIDSGAETVSEVSMLLDYFDIANTPQYKNEANEFYTTGSAKMFKAIADDWLDLETITVEQVRLSNIVR
ncbi:glutamate racemase [Enterococcus termitis]|nr:glutamate racemase [Enterococcus termitis]